MATFFSSLSAEPGDLQAIRHLMKQGSVHLVGSRGRRLPLPRPVAGLLDDILKHLLAARDVKAQPETPELTTQRAADMLGVSRPFLVRLLEEGKLPFHMAGSHRRVYRKDLLSYRAKRDRARHASIVRMARADQKAGIYDKVILPTAPLSEVLGLGATRYCG